MPAVKIGGDVTAWQIGGSAMVGQMQNAEMVINIKTAEAKAVNDTEDYPQHVGRGGEIRGEMMIYAAGSAALMGTVNSSNPAVAFTFATGANQYSGTAVITSCTHRVERDGLQMYNVTMLTRGAITISAG